MLGSDQKSVFKNKWRRVYEARAAPIADKYNFPAAIGSPDCVHVRIRKLFPYDDVYINRKGRCVAAQMYKRYAAHASNAGQARVAILKMPVVLMEFRGSYACMYALTLIALLILRLSGRCCDSARLFRRAT